jgi:hypothetical protein
VTVLLQPRSGGADSGIQLSLFGDEPGTTSARAIEPEVDGLAPVRGIMVTLSLALLVWAALLASLWAIWR